MPDPLADLKARLRPGGRVQVFTDFDGTLAEIVPDPLHVELAADVRAALEAVANHPSVRLAVVSGRDIGNLRERVRLPCIAYAGNHGLEIQGPGFSFVEPTAAAGVRALATVVAQMRAIWPDIWVQDKGLTATAHTTADMRASIQALVGKQFRVRPGRATVDILPRVDWHKGRAVEWLRCHWFDTDAVPVFLGDDPTDEDGFAACADGVTVLVGPDRPTRAAYRLADPTAVADFLRAVAGLGERPA